MGTGGVNERKAHVLVLPIEEEGHFTVYLQLLYYLNSFDIRVTICSTEARCQELAKLQSEGAFLNLDLHLKGIFSPVHVTPKKQGEPLPLLKTCSEMEAKFRTFMPTLMDEKEDCNERPTFLVADLFLGWAEEVAEKLDIPRYVMFTCAAWAPYTCLWRDRAEWTPDDIINIPGTSPARIKDVIPLPLDPLVSLKNIAGIVCNSFEELEKETIDAARAHLQRYPNNNGQVTRFLPIGPMLCLPGNPTFPKHEDTSGCVKWLSSQAPSSVLYVALGTQVTLSVPTIMAIASGIEASNVPFLWALRLSQGETELSSVLPPGFLERTKDRGNVHKSFAPQRQILGHPSVGAFLSHCGWNSSIESICAGVPVIAHPFVPSDQPQNARILIELTKTAVGLQRSDGGLFAPDEITKAIKSVMTEDVGRKVRESSARWKELALASQEDTGSSNLHALRFIQDIFDSAVRNEEKDI